MNPTMLAEFAAGLWATGAWFCLSFGAALIGLSAGPVVGKAVAARA